MLCEGNLFSTLAGNVRDKSCSEIELILRSNDHTFRSQEPSLQPRGLSGVDKIAERLTFLKYVFRVPSGKQVSIRTV
jgi:hypothetical protein